MSTWGDRLGVFDLETTGVDVDTSRIVSGCIAILDRDGAVVSRWNWLADPAIEIPEGASAVHGITTERARAEGRDARQVIAEITQTLRVLFDLGVPVTVYNAPYDLSLLDRECRRHELEPLSRVSPVIDPLVIDKAVDRFRKGKRTLEVTAQLYDVPLEGAHDAGADAIAAGRVAWALLRRYPDDLEIALADLHGRQEVWHAEQAASFQEYLRAKRGDDSYVADPSWPLKPATDTSSFLDTQPIPPLPPRRGNVPILDFSATGVLELESSRGELSEMDARRLESRAARLAAPPVVEAEPFLESEPFLEAESDDEPAWIAEPSETPFVSVESIEPSGPIQVREPIDQIESIETTDSVPPMAASHAVGEPESEPASESPTEPGPPQAVLRIAAAIVTDPDGRCLLVRKAGTTAFMQAGGKLEAGESAVDALARELHEELDLELDESTVEYLGVFRADAANEPHTLVSAAVFAFETAATLEAHGEIEELLWIDQLDDLGIELAPLSRDELLPLWASRRAGATLF